MLMADLNDIQLSTQDILKKQFRTKVKGIDPDEVDAFLDKVIADYDTFEQIIEDLYGQIGKLQGELMNDQRQKEEVLKAKPADNSTHRDVKNAVPNYSLPTQNYSESYSPLINGIPQTENSTNMAIIQRISALERKVYNLEQRVYGLQK